MSYFNILLSDDEATVVTKFESKRTVETEYQDEAKLEKAFIEQLKTQGYDYLTVKSSDDLLNNLKTQLEKLNNIKFSDTEWERFFNEHISNDKLGIKEKTDTIQVHHQKSLKRDDGTHVNIIFIDKNHVSNNKLQVINQYVNNEGTYDNRYDVTVLVNGLPLVHIELKRRGIPIKEAFNQIERYQRQSFWADTGLYEWVQIFIISNGTNTKYYSNTTRWNHVYRDKNKQKTSNSFEFTSYWADSENNHITDLTDFTSNFFQPNRLLNVLTKYCVFTIDQNLLVMRPYQIVATERILNRIELAHNHKAAGKIDAGGFIWHTTGSGKTLTSFKTAQLATKKEYIQKILFVVDRKDLDYQTMREYDRFEKGAANSNRSTEILKKQLEDPKCRIIITTIQKLSNFIKQNKHHDVYKQDIVMIFDECHRSQFGEMHKAIVDSFKKYYIFGFTGTPITAVNTTVGTKSFDKTTVQIFGDKLHTYTIDDAIKDDNVLRFRVSYLSTMKNKKGIIDEDVEGIDTEAALMADQRINNVSHYILDNFDRLTYRKTSPYQFNKITNIAELSTARNGKVNERKELKAIRGFNAILATASIDMAKKYYRALQTINVTEPEKFKKVALIYSYGANPDEALNGIIDDECSDDTKELSKDDREFLDAAIRDYNKMFKCSFDTSAKNFSNYYKDVSLRMKNMEIDILIVVNMFLTGFDATTLNTLFVDKNLKQHGLIQAFSRTNRILNDVKRFGNIVCFRNLKKRVDEAIALFADKDSASIIQLMPFECYYKGYEKDGKHVNGYLDMLEQLRSLYPINKEIIGEKAQKDFIGLFGAILRMRNILVAFDEFEDTDITERDMQDYQSKYLDLKDQYQRRGEKAQLTNVNEDIIFETELIEQDDYGVDYILSQVLKFHGQHMEDKNIEIAVNRIIDASPTLRSKKALIEAFIENLNDVQDITAAVRGWNKYATAQFNADLEKLIKQYNLNPEFTKQFVKDCLFEGGVKTTGMAINKILPPISMFDKDNKRTKVKEEVFEHIMEIYTKYYNALITL